MVQRTGTGFSEEATLETLFHRNVLSALPAGGGPCRIIASNINVPLTSYPKRLT